MQNLRRRRFESVCLFAVNILRLSITQVVFDVIVPTTKHSQTNFAQYLLLEKQGVGLGSPQYFVSHPWDGVWGELLEAMELFDENGVCWLGPFLPSTSPYPTCFVPRRCPQVCTLLKLNVTFTDIFAINQHRELHDEQQADLAGLEGHLS